MNIAHLEQTPPLSVPFRFFLTAPLFGIFASLLLLYEGPPLLTNRWSLEMLALTHLVTLGFISMVMMGAMLQLIPVLTAATIPSSRWVSALLHLFHSVGSLALTLGFLIPSPSLIHLGVMMLGLGFLGFLSVIGYHLTIQITNPIVIAMRLALIALAVTVLLGIALGSLFSHSFTLPFPPTILTHLHLIWGLTGWVGLLVIGVAYQVVPMFQITPPYPPRLTRWLVPSLFVSLVSWSVVYLFLPHLIAQLLGGLLALGFALFASTTLYLQAHRLRKLPDVTLNYWRLGMTGLLLSSSLWLWSPPPIFLGITFIGGFVLPIIQGMLYKIIPFLVWLHLQNRQLSRLNPVKLIKLPNMKQIIPDHQANRQFWLYLGGLILLSGAALGIPLLIYAAGSLLTGAFLWLAYNLYRALWLYLSVNRQMVTLAATSDLGKI